MITTKDLAIEAFGREDVLAYEQVKTFYMRLGKELEIGFAAAVGGRVGGVGESDVYTPLGRYEFCASANTKNSAGAKADHERGIRVQATGIIPHGARPIMSGEEFLEQHGIDPAFADNIRRGAAVRARIGVRGQLELAI